MTEEQLREAQAKAIRMKDVSAELFPIFEAVEKNYLETLMRSDIEDGLLREKVYHRVNALRDVRRAMEMVIAQGSGAAAIIAKLSRPNTGRKVKA